MFTGQQAETITGSKYGRIVYITVVADDIIEREIKSNLELNHLALPLLVASQLKVLGPLDGHLLPHLAAPTLQPEHQLLCGLGLKRTLRRFMH